MMNNRAYTLIELIVVMMLISTMLVISLPSLKDAVTAQPVRSEARKLVGCIVETRSRAARQQLDHLLQVDLDKGRFRACRSSDPDEMGQQPGNQEWALPKGVRIAGIRIGNGDLQQAGKAAILFSGQGYSQPAVIRLSRDDHSVSLTISPFLKEIEVRDDKEEAANEAPGEEL